MNNRPLVAKGSPKSTYGPERGSSAFVPRAFTVPARQSTLLLPEGGSRFERDDVPPTGGAHEQLAHSFGAVNVFEPGRPPTVPVQGRFRDIGVDPGRQRLEPGGRPFGHELTGLVQRHAVEAEDRIALRPATELMWTQHPAALPIQREIALDIMKAGGSVALDYVIKTLDTYKKEIFFKALEKFILSYLDVKVSNLFELDKLLERLSPLFKTLKSLKEFAEELPQPVQAGLTYAVGRLLSYALPDSWINTVLVDASPKKYLDSALQVYEDLQQPVTSAYKAASNYLAPKGWSISALIWGSESEPEKSDKQDDSQKQKGGKDDDQGGLEKLVSVESRFLWLTIDQPELKRWNEQQKKGETETGGLVLPFTCGLNLFGTVISAGQKNELKIPWGGGFRLVLLDVPIATNKELGGIVKVGKVSLPKLRITDQGLQGAGVRLDDLEIADGAVSSKRLEAYWQKQKGFQFKGDFEIDAWNNQFAGALFLAVDSEGSLTSGDLKIKSLDQFVLVKDLLTLSEPGFHGLIDADKNVMLQFFGDLELDSEHVTLDAGGAFVQYQSKQGFSAGSEQIQVSVGKYITLVILSPKISKQGLEAKEATLRFEHKPTSSDESRKDFETIGGDFQLANATDLQLIEEFVLAGTARDITLNKSGLKAKKYDFHVSKLALALMGFRAGLDFDKKEGDLSGSVDFAPAAKPIWPIEIQVPFPIVPGLEAFAALEVHGGVHAELGGKLKHDAKQAAPWGVEGSAGLAAHASLMAKLGVTAGSQFLAGLSAALFARANAEATSTATVAGRLHWDDDEKTLRQGKKAQDKLQAQYLLRLYLKADAGLVVEARLLHVFSKKLYEYKFKEWDLGNLVMKGKFGADEKGDLKVDSDKKDVAFLDGKNGLPRAPTVEVKEVSVAEANRLLLETAREIPGSGEARKELLIELYKKYVEAAVTLDASWKKAFNEKEDVHEAFQKERRRKKSNVSKLREMDQQIEALDAKMDTIKIQIKEVNLTAANLNVSMGLAKTKLERGAFTLDPVAETVDISEELDAFYEQERTKSDKSGPSRSPELKEALKRLGFT